VRLAWFPDPPPDQPEPPPLTEDPDSYNPDRLRTPAELAAMISDLWSQIQNAWEMTEPLRRKPGFPLIIGVLGFIGSFGLSWFWFLLTVANSLLFLPGLWLNPGIRGFIDELKRAREVSPVLLSK
jgi:hypothetical protein